MEMLITAASIVILTLLAWGVKKTVYARLCPPCGGTAGTWIWIVIGLWKGLLPPSPWLLIASILLGGSIVGIAFQLEKFLPEIRRQILFKMFFIPAGFSAVYGFLLRRLDIFLVGVAASLIVIGIFFIPFLMKKSPKDEKHVQELEEKMKKCC